MVVLNTALLQATRLGAQQRVGSRSTRRQAAVVRCSAASRGTSDQVWRLSEGANVHTINGVESYIKELASGAPRANIAKAALKEGQGTWRVFYAPHLKALGTLLLSKVEQVEYTLKGDEMMAQVFLTGPLGATWLSTSGSIIAEDDGTTLQLKFDKFWVDGGDQQPRPNLAGEGTAAEQAMGVVGRFLFNLEGTEFPVRYLDKKVAVFDFPLLKTKIAIRRIK